MWMSKWIKPKVTEIPEEKVNKSNDNTDRWLKKISEYADVFRGTPLESPSVQQNYENMASDRAKWVASQDQKKLGEKIQEVDSKLFHDIIDFEENAVNGVPRDAETLGKKIREEDPKIFYKIIESIDKFKDQEWDAERGAFGDDSQKSNVIEFKPRAVEKEHSHDIGHELER